MKYRLSWPKRILIAIVSLLVAGWLATGYVGARLMTAPRHSTVEARADLGGQPIENVSIQTADGVTLSAWYIPNDRERAVVLLSGIGHNREQCRYNAEVYVGLGYAVLMPDLRGAGQSGGDMISMGWYERRDLEACVQFLESKGYKQIGAHGMSLGAATICYALQDKPHLAFIVLESCYDTFENAINNRLSLRGIPHFLGWSGQWFGALRMGVPMRQLRPVDFVPLCTIPALIIAGDSEGSVKVSETQNLYKHCAAPLKRLHILKGCRHANLMKQSPAECRAAVEDFLRDAFPSSATATEEPPPAAPEPSAAQ